MRVVILGGTGLLSSAITRKCREKGHEVIHFNRGNNIDEFVKTIIGNRYKASDLEKILDYKPDIIIDMLCFNAEHAKISVDVFKNKIKQYIYTSTSCVYTPVEGDVVITEDSDTNPETEYGKNKLEAEKVFLNTTGFNVTIFRPGHVFGRDFIVTNLDFEGISLFNKMINNEDIILTCEGKKKFQSCHHDNIGEAYALSLLNERCYGEIFNIAGEEDYTWNDVYRIEKEMLGSNSKIIYKDAFDIVSTDALKYDFLNTYTRFDWNQSMEKLHDICGYEYKVDFKEGLKQFIDNNLDKIKDKNAD